MSVDGSRVGSKSRPRWLTNGGVRMRFAVPIYVTATRGCVVVITRVESIIFVSTVGFSVVVSAYLHRPRFYGTSTLRIIPTTHVQIS